MPSKTAVSSSPSPVGRESEQKHSCGFLPLVSKFEKDGSFATSLSNRFPTACGFTTVTTCEANASASNKDDPVQVDAKVAIAVPEISPELVAMLTSGLTASLGLEQVSLPF